jgi:hypothetical protein
MHVITVFIVSMYVKLNDVLLSFVTLTTRKRYLATSRPVQ